MKHDVSDQSVRPRTYAAITLGCKTNQYDTAAIVSGMEAHGMTRSEPGTADVLIVNTCMVTGPTEAQCRQAIRRARRANPDARVIVTGCMSRGSFSRLSGMPEVDQVVDPAEKGKIPGMLGFLQTAPWVDWPEDPGVGVDNRDRGFLKIQDGCDHACSYCIVPSVRGKSRSLPAGKVATAVRSLMEGGRSEVVLTAIHLGLYGKDQYPTATLDDLLCRLVDEGLPGRIRLSSMEPLEITGRLLDIIASSEGGICRHLHIPLQSGSDEVLRAMGRPYLRSDFTRIVHRARELVPGIGIGCDVICGFPGETEDDFHGTEVLIRDLAIPFLHAFPYSPRPGTRSADMSDDVPHRVKKARVRALREAATDNLRNFLDSMIGAELTVVPESAWNGADTVALADNYSRVVLKAADELCPGSLVTATIVGRDGLFLKGMR